MGCTGSKDDDLSSISGSEASTSRKGDQLDEAVESEYNDKKKKKKQSTSSKKSKRSKSKSKAKSKAKERSDKSKSKSNKATCKSTKGRSTVSAMGSKVFAMPPPSSSLLNSKISSQSVYTKGPISSVDKPYGSNAGGGVRPLKGRSTMPKSTMTNPAIGFGSTLDDNGSVFSQGSSGVSSSSAGIEGPETEPTTSVRMDNEKMLALMTKNVADVKYTVSDHQEAATATPVKSSNADAPLDDEPIDVLSVEDDNDPPSQ